MGGTTFGSRQEHMKAGNEKSGRNKRETKRTAYDVHYDHRRHDMVALSTPTLKTAAAIATSISSPSKPLPPPFCEIKNRTHSITEYSICRIITMFPEDHVSFCPRGSRCKICPCCCIPGMESS